MRTIRVSVAAKQMEVCHRTAVRRLLTWQKRYPDLVIVTDTGRRANGRTTVYLVHPVGLREAIKRERATHHEDLSVEVGLLRADVDQAQRKIRKLERCVFGNGNAARATSAAE